MRILYASERPPYPFFLGGAARCAHRLLLELAAELGSSTMAVGSADYAVTPWSFPTDPEFDALGIRGITKNRGLIDCGYPARIVPDFASTLEDVIEEFRPDILWTQLEGALPLLERARVLGVQGLYFVHDAETPPAELRAIAETGCHLVASSEFLARKTQVATGRKATVVYPCPELYFETRGDPNGFITMVNPHKVKGLPTFLAIAASLPSERFLLLESWKLDERALAELEKTLETLPNVRLMRRVADMRPVYAQTKLLLAPSIWEEGFGMVAVEAQSCGIPVIASARGGLPESVGHGGILIKDYMNPAAWLSALNRMLRDPDSLRDMSVQAMMHARSDKFAVSTSARRLLMACTSRPSRRLKFGQCVRHLKRKFFRQG